MISIISELQGITQLKPIAELVDIQKLPALNLTIEKFLMDQGELMFCVSTENVPYCASCFYSFLADRCEFVIKSEERTRHVREALQNSKIAGTIVERKRIPGVIRGIQFTGYFTRPDPERARVAELNYYSRYPFARVMKGDVWLIETNWIKMTDSTILTGQKLIWERTK